MLIDLHTHTSVESWDSSLTPEELIEGAKKAGLDGICITEHDQFWRHDNVRALAQRHDFLVIPGCEITTEEGHILTFGLKEYVFGMHRAGFLRREVDGAGGVLLAAHPYRRMFNPDDGPEVPPFGQQVDRACGNGVLDHCDGVETLNGRGSYEQNHFSMAVCTQRGMLPFGASDSHDAGDIGACATEFEGAITGLDDLIAELKAGRFHPVLMRNP